MLYFTLSEDHSVQTHGNRAKQWKKITSQQYSIFPSGKLSIFSLMAEVGCATAFPLAIQQCLIARMPVFSGSNRLANHYLPSEHTQESHLAERSPRGRTRSWLPSLPCLLPPEERQLPWRKWSGGVCAAHRCSLPKNLHATAQQESVRHFLGLWARDHNCA